jgi:hypothetical protein
VGYRPKKISLKANSCAEENLRARGDAIKQKETSAHEMAVTLNCNNLPSNVRRTISFTDDSNPRKVSETQMYWLWQLRTQTKGVSKDPGGSKEETI